MKEKEYMRLESDSIGTMEVPEDAYYGVQALRAKENFPITGTKFKSLNFSSNYKRRLCIGVSAESKQTSLFIGK